MKKLSFMVAALLLMLVGCRKNTDETTVRVNGPIEPEYVEAALAGVVKTNNALQPNATITVGDYTTTTNNKGQFIIPKRLLDSRGTMIKASYPGCFDAYRFAYPHVGSVAQVEINLLVKVISGTFLASTGGDVLLNPAGSVFFHANAIVTASGDLYAGEVRVLSQHLSPANPETMKTMPGDLRALDTEDRVKYLTTYGMFAVELESPTGEPLQLGGGQKATLKFPVPANRIAEAPTTIPMWHFNKANGYWEEEGAATLTNGEYIGDVAHFSFWNCDAPQGFAFLTLRFLLDSGEPIGNLTITMVRPNGDIGSALVDNTGQFSTPVPLNEAFAIEVKSPCGDVVYQSSIGPFTEDINMDLQLNAGSSFITLSGALKNCQLSPLPNGLVSIMTTVDTVPQYVLSDAQGNFKYSFVNCSSSDIARLKAYNFDDNTESDEQVFTVTSGLNNAGFITICNSLDEYVIVSSNGVTTTYGLNRVYGIYGGGLYGLFSADAPFASVQDSLSIRLDFTPNSAIVSSLYFETIENSSAIQYGCGYCTGCDCELADVNPIVLTQTPANVGDYAEGSVTGSVKNISNNTLVPFNLTFRIKRTF